MPKKKSAQGVRKNLNTKKVKALFKECKNAAEVARQLGCSRTAVIYHLNKP